MLSSLYLVVIYFDIIEICNYALITLLDILVSFISYYNNNNLLNHLKNTNVVVTKI